MLAQLRDRLSEFEGAGVHVACVVQGNSEETARFCGRHGVEQLCIPDPEKESYRAIGLGRTRWGEILSPSEDLKRRRKGADEAGCGVNIPGAMQKESDWLQLPGAALIAPGGRILWIHRGEHVGDLPTPEELLQVVREHSSQLGLPARIQ